MAPPASITVVMTDFKFDPANIVASGDPLLFYLVNSESSGFRHNMAITEASGHQLTVSDEVQVGHAALFSVHGLPPGRYIIKCTVDDHAADGMVGTLVVS